MEQVEREGALQTKVERGEPKKKKKQKQKLAGGLTQNLVHVENKNRRGQLNY